MQNTLKQLQQDIVVPVFNVGKKIADEAESKLQRDIDVPILKDFEQKMDVIYPNAIEFQPYEQTKKIDDPVNTNADRESVADFKEYIQNRSKISTDEDESVNDNSDAYIPSSGSSDSEPSTTYLQQRLLKEKTHLTKLTNREHNTEKKKGVTLHDKKASNMYQSKSTNITHVEACKNETKWKKKDCCYYCKKEVVKLARHLEQKHCKEREVQEYLKFGKLSKEKRDLISIIRKRGNFFHNTNEGGMLIVKRRPQKVDKKDSEFIPCPKCLGFYFKRTFYLHYKKCEKNIKKYERVQEVAKNLLPISFGTDEVLHRKILINMRDNIITETIKNDSLILKYGAHLSTKYMQHQHLINYIRQKMIQMGKLTIALKEIDSSIKQLRDVLQPSKFKIFIQAVNKVCEFNPQTGTYKIPSLPTMLGTGLRKCAQILVGDSILQEDEQERLTVENFLKIFDLHFTNLVSRPALNNVAQLKWNKQELLPLTEDIQKLNNYLKKLETDLLKALKCKFTFDCWNQLSKCLLLRIMLFNRRRAGELERLSIEDFNKRHQISVESDFYESLSPVEKIISSRYYRIVMRGKRHNPVPILISHKQVDIIKILLKYRTFAYVSLNNPFIFGRRNNNHLSAATTLKSMSHNCGAKYPELLTGTKLRKQIATISQILSLTDADMNNLAKFMGHDVKIHRNFYRLPTDAVHLAKISKLLIALNDGRINEFKGKNLDEIELNTNEEQTYNQPTVEVPKNFNMREGIAESYLENTDKNNSQELKLPAERSPFKRTKDQSMAFDSPDETSLVRKGVNDKIRNIKRRLYSEDTASSAINEGYLEDTDSSEINAGDGAKKYRFKKGVEENHKGYRKNTWHTPEKWAVKQHFKLNLTQKKLPSIGECAAIISQDAALQNRTPEQLKAYIYNQIKIAEKNPVRQGWSTPERHAARKHFGDSILQGHLPSLSQIIRVVDSAPELRARTPEQIKAWLQHEHKITFKKYKEFKI